MRNLFFVLLGTFILMIVGFYNGYPLVYSDTGTYIYSGFDKFVPNDRPITYGLFLWFFSFRFSLWLVIVAQNLITAYVLYELLKLFLKQKGQTFHFLYISILLLLTFFTGIGWYSNQIMPDFFAPVMVLTLIILIFNKELSLLKRICLYIIFIISIIVHLSHLLISLSLIVSYLALERILYKKNVIENYYLKLKNFFVILSLILISWLSLSLIHYTFGGGFKVSKSSGIFFTAHLADCGLLEKYLKENCEKSEFKSCRLCLFKDSLPNNLADFLWGPHSPYNQPNSWKSGEIECKALIKKMLKTPKYLLLNVYKSAEYGFIQLFRNEIGQGLSAYNEGSPPYGQIHWRFKSELNNYLNSRQNRWGGADLNLKVLNVFHLIILIISVFVLSYIFLIYSKSKNISPELFLFLIFCLLAIIINAFITAGLNAPCERFQARVVWLLPLSLLIIIINNPDIFKQSFLKR